MPRYQMTEDDVKALRRSVVILHGVFHEDFLKLFKKGAPHKIYIMEGRPSLEAGKRMSSKFLRMGIVPTIISDNMAGFLFARDAVKEVWLAYQSVDATGLICDVGALILGILAKVHGIPVNCFPSGRKIKFVGEARELLCFNGVRVAPQGAKAYVPLAEWLSKSLITAIHERKKCERI